MEFQDTAQQIIVDGVPDFSRLDPVDLIRDCVQEGYSITELTLDAQHIIPTLFTPESIGKLIDLKDELGHSYTSHLPFWSIELASFNEHVRKGCIESIVESIELTKPLDPLAYVLHATGEIGNYVSSLNYGGNVVSLLCTILAGYAASSIEEIVSRTEIDPRKLAIENVEFPFDIMRPLIDDLDASICFDTAHLLCQMSGTESVMDFYHAHKDRITEIHLQDGTFTQYDGIVAREDHIPLGSGIMGDSVLREFLLELVKDNFEGPVIFELTKDEATESLELIRRVVPESL
ncbi:MAG: sugar phosphate isomerase/epimerase [Candidatus Thorarchaeota archaeon]|nr:sugar phosphate isomerase/epimerase [Candidatus Thorarchaeota archaeon]